MKQNVEHVEADAKEKERLHWLTFVAKALGEKKNEADIPAVLDNNDRTRVSLGTKKQKTLIPKTNIVHQCGGTMWIYLFCILQSVT